MSRSPLVIIPEHFGSLVFDRRSSRYVPFDHAATFALRTATESGIGGALAAHPEAAAEVVLDFLSYFEQLGWFRPDGTLAADLLPATPPADHLLGPLSVHLEVLAACNLRCTHCFAGTLPRKSDLSLREIDVLLAELASLGSFRLGLTGGEPLMRKDLLDVLDSATGHGLHPCLTTNGTLLDERWARELGRRELVWINVSLEGATARTNDAVRGPGTFDDVTGRLRAFGKHFRFTLAFTITSPNAHEVEQCAELARSLGAHTAVFRPLYPVGVARGHLELMPSFAQYTEALGRLSGVAQGDLFAIDPFSPQTREPSRARTHANAGCGAGNLVASVSASGDVNPCSFLGPAFDSGNVRDRPFRDIWHDSESFRRMRATAQATAEGGACGFQGGCRARALAAHGDVDAPDPWHEEWKVLRGERLPPLTNVDAPRTALGTTKRRTLPLARDGAGR